MLQKANKKRGKPQKQAIPVRPRKGNHWYYWKCRYGLKLEIAELMKSSINNK